MKHNISIAVAAFAVAFGGCSTRPGSDQSANTVTVAGCVQSAEQGLGSPGGGENAERFMLTNANLASSAGAAPAPIDQPRSDSAAAPSAEPGGATYMLEGRTSELREHLNHQVEITGRLDDDAAESSSATPDRRPQLEVESVRMIATNCTQ